MRTFYIFKINNEYSNLTKEIPYNLYATLLSIKLMEDEDKDYLKAQYDSLTDELVEVNNIIYEKMNNLENYMVRHNLHIYNSYFTDEISRLKVFNSFMILKTNIPNSTFFTILIDIPNLFIIDFANQDYFWLSTFQNLRLVNTR